MFAGRVVGEVESGADEGTLHRRWQGEGGMKKAPQRVAGISVLRLLVNIALAFITVGIIVRIIGADPP